MRDRTLQLVQVLRPDPGDAEVEIRVAMSAVGLTQLHMVTGRVRPDGIRPIALGHEVVGRVERVGSGVSDVEVGTRVLVAPVSSCGHCRWCLDGNENTCKDRSFIGIDQPGGWSEYLCVPRSIVLPLPSGMSYQDGVLATSALPTAVRACARAQIRPGSTVAVIGVGSIGLLLLQLARVLGAGRVIAVYRGERRRTVIEPYADACIDTGPLGMDELAGQIRSASLDGEGADTVFETAGTESVLNTAVKALARRGTLVAVGVMTGTVHLALDDYHQGFLAAEPTLRTTYSYTRHDIATGLRLYQTGRLDFSDIAARTVTLAEVPDVIEAMRAAGGPRGGRYLVQIGSFE